MQEKEGFGAAQRCEQHNAAHSADQHDILFDAAFQSLPGR
jgi:hypothetical protein